MLQAQMQNRKTEKEQRSIKSVANAAVGKAADNQAEDRAETVDSPVEGEAVKGAVEAEVAKDRQEVTQTEVIGAQTDQKAHREAQEGPAEVQVTPVEDPVQEEQWPSKREGSLHRG